MLQLLVDRHGSINALAEISGTPVKTLSDWLRGVRRPHSANLNRFARTVGVSPQWLRGEAPSPLLWDEVIPLDAPDQRNSILSISRSWAKSWLGVSEPESLFVVHTPTAESIPGLIEADEPILFHQVGDDYLPLEGEIILTEDHLGVEHVIRAGKNGDFQGKIRGTAIWTGRRIQPQFRARRRD